MSHVKTPPGPSESVLDLMMEPVVRCLDAESARKLLDARVDPAVEERVAALAAKANEGLLTDAERAEYEACVNADDFISILKLKARRYLSALDVR